MSATVLATAIGALQQASRTLPGPTSFGNLEHELALSREIETLAGKCWGIEELMARVLDMAETELTRKLLWHVKSALGGHEYCDELGNLIGTISSVETDEMGDVGLFLDGEWHCYFTDFVDRLTTCGHSLAYGRSTGTTLDVLRDAAAHLDRRAAA